MNFCIFDHYLVKKKELHQIGISQKYKKSNLQLYYEGYFNNFDFDWKSVYLLPGMVTVDTKLRAFQYKTLNNILFGNKVLFKLRKVKSLLCSFCKVEDNTYMHLFYMCRKPSILWRKLPSEIFLLFRHRVPSLVS